MADNLTTQEKAWRAESDAHTLAESDIIKSDTERLRMAQASARDLAGDAQIKADNLAKTAGLTPEQNPAAPITIDQLTGRTPIG